MALRVAGVSRIDGGRLTVASKKKSRQDRFTRDAGGISVVAPVLVGRDGLGVLTFA